MLNYLQGLRAIGQDLESHGAIAFEIKIENGEYRVQCDCDLPPPGNLLSLCYTGKILEQIDFMGKLKRGRTGTGAGVETLSNLLRNLGAYIDQSQGQLLRVSNYESAGTEVVFRIEVKTPQGRRVVDDVPKPVLDQLCTVLRNNRT